MATLELKNIGHSYDKKVTDANFVIRNLNLLFQEGMTYALLGPSGCGKTTLLNIISGLITPVEGEVFFDGEPMTQVPTNKRHIAQVFQFPVVYDTMTVYENLAFPLKNHHYPKDKIPERVEQIAEMLDLKKQLHHKAAGLSADGKQKISLGRGLVREDIKAILFDEPLTVIDPHLKWQIRTQLKEIYRQVKASMIYVTHDQTEALTFADQVIVMYQGKVVQVGSPVDLFERCNHTFVGHFIGSPGMNLIEARLDKDRLLLWDFPVDTGAWKPEAGKRYQIGIRPEKIVFAPEGIPVTITHVQQLNHCRIVKVQYRSWSLKMVVLMDVEIPPHPQIAFPPEDTILFSDDWAVSTSVKVGVQGVNHE